MTEQQNDIIERMSGNTSVDSMMEDTPSNYNIANQRFDQTSDLLNAKSQQIQQQSLLQQMPVDEVQEEESQFDGDFAAEDDQALKKRRLRKKKKPLQVYQDPSMKDIKLARAYGGVPRGAPKRVMPKGIYRDVNTPGSINNRGSRMQITNVSGTVAGYNRDIASRGEEQHNYSSMQHLEELKDNPHINSHLGIHTNPSNYMNESNASFLAVPEHHIREQRLKQKKMNELKTKGKLRKNRGAGDPDFEKMFGKDIDEFLEDSDWDIESFENASNYSKGTSRSALNQDGRIRGLESIYLQRIETSMKKGGIASRKQNKKQAPKFRPMQDRFVNDPSLIMLGEDGRASGSHDPLNSMSHSRMQRPMFVESANTTAPPLNKLADQNIFSRQFQKPVQTAYRNGARIIKESPSLINIL